MLLSTTTQVIRRRDNDTVISVQLLRDDDTHDSMEIPMPAEIDAEVRKNLQMMLPRPVIDVLVRYFVAEVNWLVPSHPVRSSYSAQYFLAHML